MDNTIVQELIEKLKEEIGILTKEEKDNLKEWGIMLIKIKFQKNNTEEEKKRLKKTEQYLWRGVESMKVRIMGKVEDRVWDFLEKLLNLLKKVCLSSLI